MAPIAILSMAYAIRHDGHVRVDVIYNRFPPRLQHAIEVISFLMVAAVSALIVWLSIPYVMQRSEEHTSELQSLMRISYAVFCLKKKIKQLSAVSALTNT